MRGRGPAGERERRAWLRDVPRATSTWRRGTRGTGRAQGGPLKKVIEHETGDDAERKQLASSARGSGCDLIKPVSFLEVDCVGTSVRFRFDRPSPLQPIAVRIIA